MLFLAVLGWVLGYPLIYAGIKGDKATSNGTPLWQAPWNAFLGVFNSQYAVTVATKAQTTAALTDFTSSLAQGSTDAGTGAVGVGEAGGAAGTAAATVVNAAKGFVTRGVPYVWGAASGTAADCSGMVNYIFYHYLGISIGGYTGSGHGPTTQQTATLGKSVSRKNIQPGDVIVFNIPGEGANSHEGIYVGNGKFISEVDSAVGAAEQAVPWNLVSTIRSFFGG